LYNILIKHLVYEYIMVYNHHGLLGKLAMIHKLITIYLIVNCQAIKKFSVFLKLQHHYFFFFISEFLVRYVKLHMNYTYVWRGTKLKPEWFNWNTEEYPLVSFLFHLVLASMMDPCINTYIPVWAIFFLINLILRNYNKPHTQHDE